MHTKKLVVASLLTAAAASASAQSSVTVYGLIDSSVEYLSAVGTGGRLFRVSGLTGGQAPSRWGFRGAEDLGDGLKAVFTLESGFAPDVGTLSQGGRIFGRQAFVGLSSNTLGQLTLGRQWTMSFYALLDADVIGPGAFSMASFDAYLPNARSDNSVAYRGTFGGLTVGATYTVGRDNAPSGPACPGEGSGCKGWSLLAKYDSQVWGIAAATDVARGGAATAIVLGLPGNMAPFALPNPNDKDTHSQLNGYVRFGAGGKVGGGTIYRKVDTAVAANSFTSKLSYLGVTYPFNTSFSIDAQVLHMSNEKFDANANMAVVRGDWNFSKRTAAYVAAARMNNQGARVYSVSCASVAPALPAAHQGQTGITVGVRHSF